MNFDNIPQTLKQLNQWVGWKRETVNGREAKGPYCVTGRRASVTDPQTWSTFPTVTRVFKEGKFTGIGFVLTREDDLIGFDFDHCVHDEEIDSKILEIVRRLNSYTEYSPSGNGVRVFVKGKAPFEGTGRRKGNIEVYQHGRYLTVTGDTLNSGTPMTIEPRQTVIETLCRELFPPDEQSHASALPDVLKAILDKAFLSKNGQRLRYLFDGDIAGFPSASEADQSLCNQLAFWFSKDSQRIDTVFRASKLFRDKWDQRHFSDGTTYGQATIRQAISSCRDAYMPKPEPKKMAFMPLGELFEKVEESIDWLLDEILLAGGFSILCARPKVGKTTLARFIALCVARGVMCLNRITKAGPVLYLALEEKESEVRRHFVDMGADGTEQIYIYCTTAPENAIEQIRQAITQIKPVLLIIDPLYRLIRVKDANDYAGNSAALEPLLEIARATNTHVLCVHHNRKGDSQDIGERILGSTAIHAAFDTIINLSRNFQDNSRTIQIQQRYGEDLEECSLLFDRDTRTLSLGGSVEETRHEELKKRLIAYLNEQTEGVTEALIMEEVEGRRVQKIRIIRELLKNNTIYRTGRGGRREPFKYAINRQTNQNDTDNKKVHVPAVPACSFNREQEQIIPQSSCSHVPHVPKSIGNMYKNFLTTDGGVNKSSCSRVPTPPLKTVDLEEDLL